MKYIHIVFACLSFLFAGCSDENETAQGLLMHDNDYYYVFASKRGQRIIDSLLYDSSKDKYPYIVLNKTVDGMAEIWAQKNIFEDSPYIHGWMNLNDLYTFPERTDPVLYEKPYAGSKTRYRLERKFYRIAKIKHGWLFVIDPEDSCKRGWLAPENQYNDMRSN